MKDLDRKIAKAVKYFWTTRDQQAKKQGSRTGTRDYGGRTAVTGGAQLGGFIDLFAACLVESGIQDAEISRSARVDVALPGFFRPTKEWDLLVVANGHLIAAMEAKSQVGPSFGNNFNNRSEEAVGNAVDLWTAYREGAFRTSPRPWLGYFILLEESSGSTEPVAVKEPHFPVFEEFRGSSYARRYELLCQRLMRERLYDGAALILSNRKEGLRGGYREPSDEVGCRSFFRSLSATAIAYAKSRRGE